VDAVIDSPFQTYRERHRLCARVAGVVMIVPTKARSQLDLIPAAPCISAGLSTVSKL